MCGFMMTILMMIIDDDSDDDHDDDDDDIMLILNQSCAFLEDKRTRRSPRSCAYMAIRQAKAEV